MHPTIETASPLIKGNAVAYSQSYIHRQNLQNPKLSTARGTVKALNRIAGGVLLAEVFWDTPGLPKRVYAKDLIRVEETD
jgi:hypothetical protein